MNDILRERLIRKLDTLSEDRIYQILDYIDFLESKYAPKPSMAQNPLKRFAEGVEDTLRAGRMSAGVIGGTISASLHTPARVRATKWVEWVWITQPACGSAA